MSKIAEFKINEQQCLKLTFMVDKKQLHRFVWCSVLFVDDHKQYKLYSFDYVSHALYPFDFLLDKALKDELELHSSINEDVGILYDQYCKEGGDKNLILNNDGDWIGNDYSLWCYKELKTWIYNKGGETYLEITPLYKWHNLYPSSNEKYISYSEFLSNYTPLAIIKLKKEVVKRWREQINELIRIIEANHQKMYPNS